MAVVRIDDGLLKQLKEELKKEGNRYRYGNSVSSLINYLVYRGLSDKQGKKAGRENGKR